MNSKTAESPENTRRLVQTVMQNQEGSDLMQQAYSIWLVIMTPEGGVIGWCFGVLRL